MFPASDLIRQSFYAAAGLASGAILFALLQRQQTAILLWSATATLGVFLFFLVVSLPGVNIFTLIGQAIAKADPDVVIFQLFRAAFSNGSFADEDVQANFRHGIMTALLLASMVSAFALPDARSRISRTITKGSIVVILFIVVLSMSRSTWLAMAMVFLLYGFAVVSRSKMMMTYVLIGAPLVAAFVVFLAMATPIFALFANRLTSAGSYEGRFEISGFNLEAISNDIIFGADVVRESGSPWAHNLFLDYWTASGIFGFFSAVLFGGAVIFTCVRHGFFLARGAEDRMLHFYCAAFLCLPVARFVTVPKGHLFLTQWQSVGFALAIVAYLAWKHRTDEAGQSVAAPRLLATTR
jgi:O-antigen ligase